MTKDDWNALFAVQIGLILSVAVPVLVYVIRGGKLLW